VNRVLGILNIASKVMIFIVMTITAAVSLTTAYVMFAPDEFPKPFKLLYNYDGTVLNGPVGGGGELGPAEQIPTHEPTEAVATPGSGMMFNMSTKIINLADPAGRKYIRLTVAVEIEPDNPHYETLAEEAKTEYVTEFQAHVNARMPVMDDVVITLLSTKTYDDLYTADGKEKLRAEVKEAIQTRLADLEIMGIYFTEFVVQ
jgi:flagellar FliL protein